MPVLNRIKEYATLAMLKGIVYLNSLEGSDNVSSELEVQLDSNDPEVRERLIKRLDQEIRREKYEADYSRERARIQKFTADYEARQDEQLRASDLYNHVYRFNDPVTDATVERVMNAITYWHRSDKTPQPFEIVFNSPGGSVFAGMELYDFIQEMRRAGHYVTTSTRGMAASMGGILLQAGDKRVMGREAQVLIHEISTMAGGKLGELEDEVALIKKMQDRVANIFVTRSEQAFANGTAQEALTVTKVRRGQNRKDWWLDSDECLRLGIVDEVR